MQFKIRVTNGRYVWNEDCTLNCKTLAEARTWAVRMVERYNRTLREHERPRWVLKTIFVGNGTAQASHTWEKTNLVTIYKNKQYYDTCRCISCGATAKRFGFGSPVLDGPYKCPKYQDWCPGEKTLNIYTGPTVIRERLRGIPPIETEE